LHDKAVCAGRGKGIAISYSGVLFDDLFRSFDPAGAGLDDARVVPAWDKQDRAGYCIVGAYILSQIQAEIRNGLHLSLVSCLQASAEDACRFDYDH
jgi:hypothetical protein